MYRDLNFDESDFENESDGKDDKTRSRSPCKKERRDSKRKPSHEDRYVKRRRVRSPIKTVSYEDAISFYIRYQDSYLCKFGSDCKNDARSCKRIHCRPLMFQNLHDELNIIKCSNRVENGKFLIQDMVAATEHRWLSQQVYSRMKKDILNTCRM